MQSINYLTVIPFIGFVCYCVLLTILLGSRNNKIARMYIYYIISMIIWSFGSFVMKTDFPPSSLFWNKILVMGLIGIPVLFYHFTLVLTGITKQKGILYLGYLSAIILLIANFFGYIMSDAYVENNEFIYILGPLAPVLAIWSILYLIISFINILTKVKSKEIPFVRVKLIIYGLTLEIFGALLNFIPSIGKYPFDIVFNTINAIFIAYSIYRHKFLEIKVIVKKGLAYSLYTLILSGVYIISILGVQQSISKILGYSNFTQTLVIAVILAIAFHPLKNIVQHSIDRIFYYEKMNHQVILKNFSQIVNNILDLDEIIDSLLKAIEKGIQPRKVTLALKENDDYFYIYSNSLKDNNERLQYTDEHPIVKYFLQGNTILTISEIENSAYFSCLWSIEKKQLKKLDTEIIIPINFREKLIGMLILSEKINGTVYSLDEIDFINTLVNHAAAVIENAKMYEEAKEQAITDGLTKLHNHRYFHEILGEIISEKRYDKFSIAMIDVDLFKFYNDLYGHSAGDRALIKISEVLKESVREEDIVVRYGGEEFAIILPRIEGDESLKAIERIRRAVENSFYSSSNYGELVTISGGVANYPKDGKIAEVVLDCADKAMYTAKQTGRNKVILYSHIDSENDNVNIHIDIEKMQKSIKAAYISSIYALAATIDAKDRYTYGHSENVSNIAVILAKAAGVKEERIEVIKNAGLLHDIGKIGIPESILTKPDDLTKNEFDTMKKHVEIAITIIKHVPNLIEVIPAIMSHHEKFDGTGYPRGIKGESIPIEGRCLCIVDAFDAMITDRPYRKALSVEQAINELKRCSGTQFDPKLTNIFIKLLEEGKLNDFTIVNRLI